ncbi:MAG: hypothetical protein IJ151_03605 [Bacteroidales bacterium]|nr:hypothetical protein [Bacteroidales bacterium]
MKRIISIIIVLMAVIPTFAQVTDIKNLVNKTPQEIVNLYPDSSLNTDAMWDYGVNAIVNGNSFTIGYDQDPSGRYSINYFDFTSTSFCLFSDFINGGIKIGDTLARLQSIDFVHTPYGRGDNGNALTQENTNSYIVYGNEFLYINFLIGNGTIAKIYIRTLADNNPNNINPNSPFGN